MEETPSASPWSYPIFRAIWGSTLLSNFGGLIQSVGAAWLMTTLSSSSQMVALVQASVTLPILLLSLLAGAVADNLDRRHVMLFAQTIMLTVSIALAIAAYAGWLTPSTLLIFTFLIGCGTALNGPAWQASVGDMVKRPALPAAVALNSMSFNIARSLGPAIGGAIVAVAGAGAAFLVNACSYISLIVTLARWRPDRPPRLLPPERIDLAMAAGVRYVMLSPDIRRVLFRALLFGMAAAALSALMPLIARDLVRGGALTYGLLLGAFGVGAVVGAVSVRRLRARLATEPMVQGATAGFAVATFTIGFSPFLWLTVPALMLAGACWVLVLSTFNVTIQLSAPRWVVARALALYQTFAFGGMAIGAWGFGAIAEATSIPLALAIAATLHLVTSAGGLLQPLPAVLDANLDPLMRGHTPETAVPIRSRSGPIVVEIDYRIAENRIPAFLSVMSERRRIRRRDGARHWTLLRDLADPLHWTERYTVATWLDYLRHIERRTQADAENIEQIFELHSGPERPRVRRMIERETHTLPGHARSELHDLPTPIAEPPGA